MMILFLCFRSRASSPTRLPFNKELTDQRLTFETKHLSTSSPDSLTDWLVIKMSYVGLDRWMYLIFPSFCCECVLNQKQNQNQNVNIEVILFAFPLTLSLSSSTILKLSLSRIFYYPCSDECGEGVVEAAGVYKVF